MKALFYIISILAIGYLAVQTQFVKDIGSRLNPFSITSASPNNSSEKNIGQNAEQDTPQDAGQNETQNAQLQAALRAEIAVLHTTNQSLMQRVQALEARLPSADIAIQSNPAMELAKDKPKAAAEAPLDGKFSVVNMQESTYSPTNRVKHEALTGLGTQPIQSKSASQASDSQQQKRIQQQAMLRELSQRMQLNALTSLSQ